MKNNQIYLFALLSMLLIFGCKNEKDASTEAPVYDLVILNGRVIDPETKTDTILHIGVNGQSIEKVSSSLLKGTKTIDASGKTVSPGFIDLHSHSPFPLGESFQVRDGATTLLDLEAGAYPYKASTGWDYVIVNGEIAVENDQLTSNRAGKRVTANK